MGNRLENRYNTNFTASDFLIRIYLEELGDKVVELRPLSADKLCRNINC